MESNVRRLQLAELDILKTFIAICDKHHLTYFMLGGTMLGAIRHKGFIPWDDDIDMGLPRADYDRFLQVAEKELKAPLQLHTTQNGKGLYSYYYTRIENTDIQLIKKATINQTQIPVWIDVFPLDGVPDDDQQMLKWVKKCKRWKKVFSYSQASYTAATDERRKKRGRAESLLRSAFLALKLDRLINTQWAWKKLDRVARENDYATSRRIMNVCGAYGMKNIFDKSFFGEGALYPFEDIQVRGPKEYDKVLSQQYGDYMTPPDANHRERHYIEIVE